MREVVEGGYVYLSQPPTHGFHMGKKISYIYSDHEYGLKLDEIIAERKQKGVEINSEDTKEKQAGVSVTRFKGLGEMDADQLWDTTMDPENRVLLQVTVEDAEKADAVFSKLMGDEVELRKNFIQTHAKFVKDLDI